MADQFVGEIRIFGCNFAPRNWAFCNGQLLPISQNTALFSLLGTYYGGNGSSNFALPNLQGSAPLHSGQGPGLSERTIGESGGQAAVTLIPSQMPAHSHPASCNPGAGTQTDPSGHVWATGHVGRQTVNLYSQTAGTAPTMNPAALAPVGGSQPHNNMPPYLVLNFCIALAGIFPQRP